MSDAARARALVGLGLAAGLVFGLGLALGGMTRAGNVLAFLDLGGLARGAWDGRLALVVGGGVAVFLPAWRYVSRRGRPLLGDALGVPPEGPVDARLLAGAAIFGVGWGLAGYCPGPALVSLGAGLLDGDLLAASVVFVAAMIAGQRLAALAGARARGAPGPESGCSPALPEAAGPRQSSGPSPGSSRSAARVSM